MQRLCGRILILVAIALATEAPARAQDGRTQLAVHLQDVLVMRYWGQIEATVDASGDVALRAVGPARSGEAGDVELSVHLQGVPQAPVTALLPGAFAVQSLSGSGMTQVSLRIEQPLARHAAGGEVAAVSALAVVEGAAGASVAFTSPGLARAVVGDLRLTLDAASARQPGWYHGISLRLVAENL